MILLSRNCILVAVIPWRKTLRRGGEEEIFLSYLYLILIYASTEADTNTLEDFLAKFWTGLGKQTNVIYRVDS